MPAAWLASYPRSGNTWCRLALQSIRERRALGRLDGVNAFGINAASRARIDSLLEIDTAHLTDRELETLRPDYHAALAGSAQDAVYKVHDAWNRAPDGRPCFDASFTSATLYLVRDPRDVALSWARFSDTPVDRAIAFLNDPNALLVDARSRRLQLPQKLGRWSDHVASWIDESGLDPLVIRYEDMLRDPARALSAMVARLGWTRDDEGIARAVDETRFARLAELETHQGFVENSPGAARFFHSGRAGAWRDVLTTAQLRRIEDVHGAMMARFGYR